MKGVLTSSIFVRSNDYREEFFKHYKGFEDKYYLCAYCSKRLTKEDVSVDHIIPVSKVSKSRFLKAVIKMLKIEDVNSYKNLVASCSKYNNYKRSKLTLLYLLRGFWRRYIVSHIVFWGSVIFLFLFAVIMFLYEKDLKEKFWRNYNHKNRAKAYKFECGIREGNADLVTIESYLGNYQINAFEFKLI